MSPTWNSPHLQVCSYTLCSVSQTYKATRCNLVGVKCYSWLNPKNLNTAVAPHIENACQHNPCTQYFCSTSHIIPEGTRSLAFSRSTDHMLKGLANSHDPWIIFERIKSSSAGTLHPEENWSCSSWTWGPWAFPGSSVISWQSRHTSDVDILEYIHSGHSALPSMHWLMKCHADRTLLMSSWKVIGCCLLWFSEKKD